MHDENTEHLFFDLFHVRSLAERSGECADVRETDVAVLVGEWNFLIRNSVKMCVVYTRNHTIPTQKFFFHEFLIRNQTEMSSFGSAFSNNDGVDVLMTMVYHVDVANTSKQPNVVNEL